MNGKLLALVLGLGLLAAVAVVRAQEESGSAMSSEESSAPPPAAMGEGEGEGELSGPAEQHEQSARQVDNPKSGAKITIISNSNVLNSVSKKQDNGNAHKFMEQDNKNTQEQHQKKQYEDSRADAAEAKKKEQVKEERAKEVEAEEKKKKEEREKEEAKKAEEKRQEEAKKKEVEEGQKKEAEQAGKAQEQRNKAAEEQRNKAAEEERSKASNLNLQNGWHNYQHGYELATAAMWQGRDYCVVHGLIRGGNGHIGWLPDNCRPAEGVIMFSQLRDNQPVRIDIHSDGRIYYVTPKGSDWLSLDGIAFDRHRRGDVYGLSSNQGKPWGWTTYGYGWRDTTQSNHDGYCTLSGLIRSQGGGWGWFGQMMGSCHPGDGRLIFSACNHYGTQRVDVVPSGHFCYSGGNHDHGWVSLDGIAFTQHGGNHLNLFNGWYNYGHGYRVGSFRRVGRICSLSGLIRSGGWNHHISTLPSGCRPRRRLIFGGNVHVSSARVDITPDGQVLFITGKQSWDWLSLSGIKFIAYQ